MRRSNVHRHTMVLALISGLLFTGTPSHAEKTSQTSGATPTLRLAIPEIWPWAWHREDGTITGPLVRLADRLTAIANVPLTYDVFPQKRAFRAFRSGSSDLTMLLKGPRIEAAGRSVGRILTTPIYIASLKSHPNPMGGILGDQTIAYTHGTYYGDQVDRLPSVRKIPVRDMRQALDLLEIGRLDAIIGTRLALMYAIKNADERPAAFRFGVFNPGREGLLYFSRQSEHQHLIQPLRRALRQLRRDGELDAIFQVPRQASSDRTR